MSRKKPNVEGITSELHEASLFFQRASATPPPKRAALDGKQFKVVIPPNSDPLKRIIPTEPLAQTSRVTEFQTTRLPDNQTSRVPDLQGYDVPDYKALERIEVRLTWEQNKYLNDLEAIIARDVPEGDRSDPGYRRITKNSIIRVLVEVAKRLNIQVDASTFRSEKDLLKAIQEELQRKLIDLQSSRLPE